MKTIARGIEVVVVPHDFKRAQRASEVQLEIGKKGCHVIEILECD